MLETRKSCIHHFLCKTLKTGNKMKKEKKNSILVFISENIQSKNENSKQTKNVFDWQESGIMKQGNSEECF